jgi:hypothetical protein
MAFDSFLPRDDTTIAQPNQGTQASENIWTRPQTTIDVEDNACERSSRPSVTLWDEISPAPRAMSDALDDPPPKG